MSDSFPSAPSSDTSLPAGVRGASARHTAAASSGPTGAGTAGTALATDDADTVPTRTGWQRLLWAGIFMLMGLGLAGLVVITVRLFGEIVLN